MDLKIVTAPADVLKAVAKEVSPQELAAGIVGDVVLRDLATSMLELMHASGGIGLAAPQVGFGLRMWVADISGGSRPYVAINPKLSGHSGLTTRVEGCLSLPGIDVDVQRAEVVTVECLDLDGTQRAMRIAGLLARVVQHETDHLDGILITDRGQVMGGQNDS
jgi:peptide deformylase